MRKLAIGNLILALSALVLTLAALFGCSAYPKPPRGSEAARVEEAIRATMQLEVICEVGPGVRGTGFAVSDRDVMTAAHVIEGCGPNTVPVKILAYLREKRDETPAELFPAVWNTDLDVGLLTADAKGPVFRSWLNVADSDAGIGEEVCLSAFDGPGTYAYTCGVVTGGNIAMRVVPGNSGGAVLLDNRVVGIMVRGAWFEGYTFFGQMVPVGKWRHLLP